MPSTVAGPHELDPRPHAQGRAVRVVGVLTALWCVGFAAVNIVFELTDRLDGGPYAEYAAGLTVMNWLVVGLKLVGGAVAMSSIASGPRWLSPTALAVLLWGAFATIAVYAAGNVAQAIGMASGVTGSPDEIELVGVGYVLFFIAAAMGFGVLAVSHTRRHQVPRVFAALGVAGAPAVLLLVLMVVPTLLAALGVMPAA